MDEIDAVRPYNRQNFVYIQPGVVGSVGDVNCQVRYKHSAPDLPLRFDPHFRGKNEVFLGSNIQDGGMVGYCSGGAQARLVDGNWGGRRGFKTARGWKFEDARAPDDLVEPYVGTTLDYSWRNKIATVYDTKRTGSNFLPLPMGYQPSPGEISRGSSVRVTDVVPGDLQPGALGDSVVVQGLEDQQRSRGFPMPVVSRPMNSNPSNAGRASLGIQKDLSTRINDMPKKV
jgi:hypothetical protein